VPSRVGRSRVWGYVAAGWASVFAGVHLFWALGGSAGLASSAGSRLARDRPGWFVVAGLWGVGGMLVMGAFLGVALARARPRPPPRMRRLLVPAGAGAAVLLCVRAIGIELLMLVGAYDGNAAITPAQRHWTLMLWNPWFLAGGVAFGLAAWAMVRADRPE
jgi:hypothetical protein